MEEAGALGSPADRRPDGTRRADWSRRPTSLDAERDVLAQERDALKAALAKASRRSGYAVLPYKGPNGTWRRPIVLECTAGGVKLQPQGLSFLAMELSPLVNPRSSPLVRAIAHEMLHIRAADTPDGAPAVPYLVFLVRPSGIRPYYEARTCLEPLGIAFGYELIEQDLAVEIPDFDNLVTWDGTGTLEMPLEPAPRAKDNDRDEFRERRRWPRRFGRARPSREEAMRHRRAGGRQALAGVVQPPAKGPATRKTQPRKTSSGHLGAGERRP